MSKRDLLIREMRLFAQDLRLRHQRACVHDIYVNVCVFLSLSLSLSLSVYTSKAPVCVCAREFSKISAQ